jgi:hypothetical protein
MANDKCLRFNVLPYRFTYSFFATDDSGLSPCILDICPRDAGGLCVEVQYWDIWLDNAVDEHSLGDVVNQRDWYQLRVSEECGKHLAVDSNSGSNVISLRRARSGWVTLMELNEFAQFSHTGSLACILCSTSLRPRYPVHNPLTVELKGRDTSLYRARTLALRAGIMVINWVPLLLVFQCLRHRACVLRVSLMSLLVLVGRMCIHVRSGTGAITSARPSQVDPNLLVALFVDTSTLLECQSSCLSSTKQCFAPAAANSTYGICTMFRSL